jgi:hypothetical protein
MDRNYIDEQHVIARYLADQLTEPERDAFESYMDQDPDVIRDMEATARFKVALAILRERGLLDQWLSTGGKVDG